MGKRAAVFLAASMVAGCAIVTGSTDGFHVPVEAGCAEGGPDGSCGAPACTSSADCGDGGAVCCLVTIAGIRTTSTCMQGSCVGAVPVQVCRVGAGAGGDECADGGTCTMQSCPGFPVSIQACGILPGCTAL
jgi:hypothetical protein